jgi:manganese transport protein
MVDPYVITAKTVKAPPTSFIKMFGFLGPGFILSASIVGSGELIATTILGAKAGFTAMWIIIISCLAKVAVQLEFGKHAITTGETCMQSFNKLPGFSIGHGRWPVWTMLFLVTLKIVQVGGILGGTVVVLNMLYSGLSIPAWSIVIALAISLLVFNGNYGAVEKISLGMIALFTILTLTSLIAFQSTPYALSFSNLVDGLSFKLSGEVVGIAIGAFGITGVASDEIIAYNYWCLEKGYASYTGPKEDTDAWRTRARGWIRVMYLDASVAMIIYTTVTVAFYLLGASVLHGRGEIPQGNEVIETLAFIYTESLGPGIKTAYLLGAFFVLFSSVYATAAFWTRLFPDIFGQLGFIDFFDANQRKKVIGILAWIFPLLWATAYLFIQLPVLMVLSGGIVGSFMLFIVVFAAFNYKYKREQPVRSGLAYDVAFWVSVASILGVGAYGITQLLL